MVRTTRRDRAIHRAAAGFSAAAPTDARPSEETRCARQILSGLARRAYRRPVNDKDVRTLLTFYDSGRRDGFEAGIRAALERVLIDPEFLFRIERDPAGQAGGQAASGAYRLSDLELASRLSFFLWSSIPDEELLAVAERGQLDEPAVLERQVRRMLADPRSGALVSNFVCPVAAPAQSAGRGAGWRAVPGVRRQPARRLPARNGTVVRRVRSATTGASSTC